MPLFVFCALWIGVASFDGKPPPDQNPPAPTTQPAVTAETARGALDFTMKSIDGQDVPLSKYRGKVVLIVNVASKCGLTPQYEQLEALHERYGERGLVVLGFPANEFGQQEPGTNAQIKDFCTTKFGVRFDMFAKVVVKGDEQCELYKYLTAEKRGAKLGGEIRWNFTKFLIGRDGELIARFEPRVRPDDEAVTKAIAAALEEPVPADAAVPVKNGKPGSP